MKNRIHDRENSISHAATGDTENILATHTHIIDPVQEVDAQHNIHEYVYKEYVLYYLFEII